MPHDPIQAFTQRLARHEAQLRKLADDAASLREALEDVLRDDQKARLVSRPTLRSRVLESLSEVGVPLPADVLSYYDYARSNLVEEERASRFGTLRADELRSYGRNSPRPVWLACGLTPTGDPVKRVWALSTWDLADRIVTPNTERRALLRAALALYQNAEPDPDDDGVPFGWIAAASLTRQAGLSERAGGDEWFAELDAVLTRLDAEDRPVRQKAADHLRRLPPAQLLFGVTDEAAASPTRGRTPAKKPSRKEAR